MPFDVPTQSVTYVGTRLRGGFPEVPVDIQLLLVALVVVWGVLFLAITKGA